MAEKALVVYDNDGRLCPADLEGMVRVCDMYLKSGMLPRGIDTLPAAMVWGNAAKELKIGFTAALTGICVFNGKPLLHSKLPLALAIQTGQFRGITEEWTGLAPDGSLTPASVCVVTVKRQIADSVLSFVGRFGVADQKQAGLAGKGTHGMYPKDMIFHRAKTRALDRGFPDALCGMGTVQPEDEDELFRPRKVVVNEAAPAASTSAIDAIPDETPTGAGEQAAPPVSPAPVAADKFAAEMAVEMEKPKAKRPAFDLAGNPKD